MIRHDHVDGPLGQPRPQPLPVGRTADWGADLGGSGTVGNALGLKDQIMGAGFDADPYALAYCRGNHRQGIGAGKMQHMRPCAGVASGFDHLGDGEGFDAVRAGGQKVGIVPGADVGQMRHGGRAFGMDDEDGAKPRRAAHHRFHMLGGDARKLRHAGVAEEGLEPQHPRSMKRGHIGKV